MNINDFKDIYSGIHATPELKKRVLEKAAEQDNAKREPRFFRVSGAIMATAAAFALIIGGVFLIRFLNAATEPTIVVTAGEMPELIDTPILTTSAEAAQSAQGVNKTEKGYFITDTPPLTNEFTSDYSFVNVYDETFAQSPSEKYSNLYEWVVGEDISEEKAREMLSGTGLDEFEIDAIATRNESFCEKIFTMNAYQADINGERTYLTAADLYSYDVRDYYTLVWSGITVEDMESVAKRMYEIAGESSCYYAMKRNALLYKSLVLSYETVISISDSWAREYFNERVTTLYSPFEDLFDDEQIEAAKNTAGVPNAATVFNYYMLIKRTGVSEEAARAALEQCKNETAARLFKDSEIDLIVGNDSYLFTKHFISPYAEMSYQSLAGGSSIVTSEHMIICGAYGWLVDYSDINPYSVVDAVTEKLAEGGYSEILDYCEEQLDIYGEICDITENKLGGAVLPRDMELLNDTKLELTDSERMRLRQLSFAMGKTGFTGETIYEADLNYLLCFDSASVTEAIDKVCEQLNSDKKKWLTVKKNLYLYHLRTDGFSLYNAEYIGALLDSSAYSWRLDGMRVYVEPYYDSVIDYLKRYHITGVKSDEYAAQTLYSEVVIGKTGGYIVSVEAQIGAISGEGYYNTLDNTRLCIYSEDGTLLSYSYSSNGMAGLDGYLVYVVPDEVYFDVYKAPSGEILIVLHTFYPERYREEGEAFMIDEAAKELKRFETSAIDSDFYDGYAFGMFDYGDEGLTLVSDSEPIFRNEKDGQLIYFDFGTMLMRPVDNVSYSVG